MNVTSAVNSHAPLGVEKRSSTVIVVLHHKGCFGTLSMPVYHADCLQDQLPSLISVMYLR